MCRVEAFLLGILCCFVTLIATAILTHTAPDYKVIAPHKPDGDALHAPNGTAAPAVYQYDADEWEVVATVDDRLVLRRRKAK